jgi:thymidine kinase
LTNRIDLGAISVSNDVTAAGLPTDFRQVSFSGKNSRFLAIAQEITTTFGT